MTRLARLLSACLLLASTAAFTVGPPALSAAAAAHRLRSGGVVRGAVRAKKASKATAKPAAKAAESENFKKADLIASVAEKSGLTKKDAEAALTALLATVQEQVALDKKVTLGGFGTFSLKSRSARKGRNPQTGEAIDIAASKTPGFSPAKAWKDMVNGK